MVRNNKKLSFIAFVSIQSAFMFGSQIVSVMPGLEMPSTVAHRLSNHATTHAAHAQRVANEAANHAVAMQAMVRHLTAVQGLAQAETEQLEAAVRTVQAYLSSPNPKNGTLKQGVPGATYADYAKSVNFIKAQARQLMTYALNDLLEVEEILAVLPKVTIEDQTVQAELNMARNALKAVLKK